MRHRILVCFSLLVMLAFQAKAATTDLKLWYRTPAKEWNEALPVGNGRLGAMVTGGTNKEVIYLKEQSLWSGQPADKTNPKSRSFLPHIRKAIFEGNYQKGDSLINLSEGGFTESYMPLGQLTLDFSNSTSVTDYYRELNLNTAITTSTFKRNGVEYSQEVFSSIPDQIIVIRLRADLKGKISFTAGLNSLLRNHITSSPDGLLVMTGVAPIHVDPDYMGETENPVIYDETGKEGTRFDTRVKIINKSGKIESFGDSLKVINADEVVILVSAATSFNGFDKFPGSQGKDPAVQSKGNISMAMGKTYSQLKEAHIKAYQKFFNRVSFKLTEEKDTIATYKRLLAYKAEAPDLHLDQLLFNYGRYLLISSSQPGGLPANLQGIWSNKLRPPWSDNFTNNINIQMNYWPAEVTNLSEMHQPMLRYIHDLSITGAKTAAIHYGIEKGWCAHHNSDIWALTNPVGNYGKSGVGSVCWAAFPMTGAWYCQHLWTHYEYSLDKDFLRNEAYPLMKGAAEFLLEWLIEGPEGYLVTNPSTSPENRYITSTGYVGSAQIASTIDMTLCKELFGNIIHASKILDSDQDFAKKLSETIKKLPPYKIGKHGNLQEWFYDWDDKEPTHRHVSHLYGLYPGNLISPEKTPELANACKQTLIQRGDEGTGWSTALRVCLWSRLKDGNKAHSLFGYLLRYVDPANYERGDKGGGSYPNLLGACPPFMIDGNFGVTAGIAEMLLQSEDGKIELLPALPKVWKDGKISGLRAKGGYTMNISWKNGKLLKASVIADRNNTVNIKYRDKAVVVNAKIGEEIRIKL